MKSILHKATAAAVEHDPFPHVVIDDALEPDLYAALGASFPSWKSFVADGKTQNNCNYRISSTELLTVGRHASAWRELATLHTSTEFFRDVIDVFGDAIRTIHPTLEEQIGKRLEDAATNVRYSEPLSDFAMDCQITWTSPVRRRSSSAPCHVDRDVALYAGMLYMRPADDHVDGGDLELYRFRPGQRRYNPDRSVDPRRVETIKRIGYAANRLVFFIHSPDAVHGVTQRSPTPLPRLHVNFIAEAREKIFSLPGSATGEAA
jgi:hypothetical protein